MLLFLRGGTEAPAAGSRGLLAFWMGGGSVFAPSDTGFPGGGFPTHQGSLYWKKYLEENRELKDCSPKRRHLIDELDEMIIQLSEKIEEAPPQLEEDQYEQAIRVSSALARHGCMAEVGTAEIVSQIEMLKKAIEELDDEETILLSIH